MTIDNVLEILEKHKLHIPSNVFYELKADIVNFEMPTTKNDLGVDCIDRNSIKYYSGQGGYMYASKGEIDKLPSVTPQEPILDKIRAEIKHFMYDINPSSSESDYACNYILDILNKYKAESEK